MDDSTTIYLRFLDVFEHECSWDRVVPSQGCVFTKIILPGPGFSSIHICFCSNAPPLVFQSHHDCWNPLLKPLLILFFHIFALRWCEGENPSIFIFFFHLKLQFFFFFIFSPPRVSFFYQLRFIKKSDQYRYGHKWDSPRLIPNLYINSQLGSRTIS